MIAGSRAQYKGTGTITGKAGSYKFFLTAIDGDVNTAGGPDKFRIKFWDAAVEDVMIYDNQPGATLDSNPATVIQSGSIVIHSKGKK